MKINNNKEEVEETWKRKEFPLNHFKSREQENVLKNCRGMNIIIIFSLQVYLPFSIADTLTINTSLIHLIYIDLCLKQKIFLKITYWNILKSTGSLNSVGHSVHDGDEKTARLLCTSFVPSKYLFIYSFIYFSFIYLPRTRTFLHPGDFLELWESDHVDIQKQFDEFLDNGYFYSFQDIYLSSFP